MRIIFRIAFIFFLSLNLAYGQKLENGIYIGYDGGLVPKYAILTVSGDSASMEIYTRWQGAWLPAIGAWDNSYKPQLLTLGSDYSLSNENIRVKNKAKKSQTKIIGVARNTFLGKINFDLTLVERLPEKYQTVREKSIAFTKNKDQL